MYYRRPRVYETSNIGDTWLYEGKYRRNIVLAKVSNRILLKNF